MRNKRFLIFLSLTILFGFLAARAIIEIVQSHTPMVRYDDPVPVAMAKKEIRPYSVITPDQIEIKELPASVVPGDAIDDPAEIRGKVARGFLLSGDIIRKGHLLDREATENAVVAKLSSIGRADMRAFPVPKPEGLIVHEGDRIDIISIERGRDYSTAKTAFRNILVLETNETHIYLAVQQNEAERLASILAQGQVSYLLSPTTRGGEA